MAMTKLEQNKYENLKNDNYKLRNNNSKLRSNNHDLRRVVYTLIGLIVLILMFGFLNKMDVEAKERALVRCNGAIVTKYTNQGDVYYVCK